MIHTTTFAMCFMITMSRSRNGMEWNVAMDFSKSFVEDFTLPRGEFV